MRRTVAVVVVVVALVAVATSAFAQARGAQLRDCSGCYHAYSFRTYSGSFIVQTGALISWNNTRGTADIALSIKCKMADGTWDDWADSWGTDHFLTMSIGEFGNNECEALVGAYDGDVHYIIDIFGTNIRQVSWGSNQAAEGETLIELPRQLEHDAEAARQRQRRAGR